jgi:hypothetical protein
MNVICRQVGDWEERADETEGREFQYTVSLKLPSALQSALGGFGDMTLSEKQTLERGLSSYVISTEISPQSGLIGFKQVQTRVVGLCLAASLWCPCALVVASALRRISDVSVFRCVRVESPLLGLTSRLFLGFRAGGDVGVERAA